MSDIKITKIGEIILTPQGGVVFAEFNADVSDQHSRHQVFMAMLDAFYDEVKRRVDQEPYDLPKFFIPEPKLLGGK